MKQQWSQSAITRLYKGLTNIKHAEVLAHEVEQTVWRGRQWSSATNSLLSACSQSGGDALSRQHVSLSLLQTPSTLVKDSVLFDNYHIYSANPHLLVQLYNTESMRARAPPDWRSARAHLYHQEKLEVVANCLWCKLFTISACTHKVTHFQGSTWAEIFCRDLLLK